MVKLLVYMSLLPSKDVVHGCIKSSKKISKKSLLSERKEEQEAINYYNLITMGGVAIYVTMIFMAG